MKRIPFLPVLFIVLLFYFSCSQADTKSLTQQLIELLTENVAPKADTPGAVLLVSSPKLGTITIAAGFADIHNLLNVLQRLCNMGNTVVVIEHNLDVVKMADYIIDLGPEGGDAGGEVVAVGPPEEIIKNQKSYTAKYLKRKLQQEGGILNHKKKSKAVV